MSVRKSTVPVPPAAQENEMPPLEKWTLYDKDDGVVAVVYSSEADARLFDAAKDLLEVCKEVENFWACDLWESTAKKLRAAIAKAEGTECTENETMTE